MYPLPFHIATTIAFSFCQSSGTFLAPQAMFKVLTNQLLRVSPPVLSTHDYGSSPRGELPPVHEICSDEDNPVTYLCKLSVNAKMCVHVFLISKVARAAQCSTYSFSFYTCAVFIRFFPWSLSEKAGRSIHFPRIGEGGVLPRASCILH